MTVLKHGLWRFSQHSRSPTHGIPELLTSISGPGPGWWPQMASLMPGCLSTFFEHAPNINTSDHPTLKNMILGRKYLMGKNMFLPNIKQRWWYYTSKLSNSQYVSCSSSGSQSEAAADFAAEAMSSFCFAPLAWTRANRTLLGSGETAVGSKVALHCNRYSSLLIIIHHDSSLFIIIHLCLYD